MSHVLDRPRTSTPMVTPPVPKKPMARRRIRALLVTVATLACIVWFVAPLLWLIRASVSPLSELTQTPPAWIPQTLTLDSYQALLDAFLNPSSSGYSIPELIVSGLRNSVIVSVTVTAVNLVLGMMAAYGFSRLRFRGQRVILLSLLGSRMIPAVAIIIPLFLIFIQFGLFDTLPGLILAELSATLPFTVWILKNYVDTVDTDLDEAATMDGANRLQVMFHVIVPVCKPGLAAAGVFAFMLTWNSFIFPLILSGSPEVMTVQPQLASAYGVQRAEFGILFAGAVLAALPPLFVALFIRRFLSQGLLTGALKG